MYAPSGLFFFSFFFNDTPPTEIYTLSLHDALPIYRHLPHGSRRGEVVLPLAGDQPEQPRRYRSPGQRDRKSTRLNSSHGYISYAVFCLKKKSELQLERVEDAEGEVRPIAAPHRMRH